MPDYTDNVLLMLREIARTEPKVELSLAAKRAADKLQMAIAAFYHKPSKGYLQDINGLWAAGQRIIDVWVAPEPTPPRRAGAGSVYVKSWEECATRKAA